MFSDLVPLYPLIVPFLLVLFRLLGLLAFVPFYSNASIPGNVKVLLALAMTFCVWNVVPGIHGELGGNGSVGVGGSVVVLPTNLVSLVVAIAGEMSVGLLIGTMVGCVYLGIQLGAHLVSQQMGLSLANLYNPSFEDQSTIIEQVAFWIALVAFLAMGGHRELLNTIVYSYHAVPLGSGLGGGLAPDVMLQMVCGSLSAAFHAATRVGMPALVAFFISTLTSGLMTRAMPQLSLMHLGITLNLVVGFVMVMLGLTGWAAVSTESFQNMFSALARLFGA